MQGIKNTQNDIVLKEALNRVAYSNAVMQKAIDKLNNLPYFHNSDLHQALTNISNSETIVQQSFDQLNNLSNLDNTSLTKIINDIKSHQMKLKIANAEVNSNLLSVQIFINKLNEQYSSKTFSTTEFLNTVNSFSMYLKPSFFHEILTAIESFSTVDVSTLEDDLDAENLQNYIENEIHTISENKISLKEFLNKIAITFGVTAVIGIITTILIPYVLSLYPVFMDSHQHVINVVQEILNSLISALGDEVITMAMIQDKVGQENLSNYENLNLIGILRVDTFIRKGSSKTAPIAFPNKIKANTVVDLLELTQKLNVKRKNNWLKVNLHIEDTYVEGWVEESKVQRLKKVD